jgi:RNA polymerase sigma factor (sigma-70 family)
VSYNHELIDSMRHACKPSTKQDNERLYGSLLAGNTVAGEELIVNNMPLVVSIIDGYLKKFPELETERDDLTAEGFLALTRAVKALNLSNTAACNVTGYLGRSVENHLVDLARKRARQVVTQSSDVDYSKRSLAGIDSIERVEVEDLLRHACKTAFDWSLVRLRLEGHTTREIAAQYGISNSTIKRALKLVRDRFFRSQRVTCLS